MRGCGRAVWRRRRRDREMIVSYNSISDVTSIEEKHYPCRNQFEIFS